MECNYQFQFVCMINLNSILVTFPEWGQKVPPLSLFGGEKLFHVFLNQINFKS